MDEILSQVPNPEEIYLPEEAEADHTTQAVFPAVILESSAATVSIQLQKPVPACNGNTALQIQLVSRTLKLHRM